MNDIGVPSDEDFSRAKRLRVERSKNIDAVNAAITQRFIGCSPLHYFILIPQRDNEFLATVFYTSDQELQDCKGSGFNDQIERFVYEELERQGRGEKGEINVRFEFDSHENVLRHFKGDYFLRLR